MSSPAKSPSVSRQYADLSNLSDRSRGTNLDALIENEDSSSDSISPPTKKAKTKDLTSKKTSSVYAFYDHVISEGNSSGHYICKIRAEQGKLCPQYVKGPGTNLWKHLESHHKKVYEAVQKAKSHKYNIEACIADLLTEWALKKEVTLDRYLLRQKKAPSQLRNEILLVLWMAKRSIPFDAIDDALFHLLYEVFFSLDLLVLMII